MKELEDYPFFPNLLRKFQTDYIGTIVKWFNVYKPIIRLINNSNYNSNELWDLCSGSSEPAEYIFKNQNKFQNLILSDKFPQSLRHQDNIDYKKESIDAINHEFNSNYCYTMFNAFHHFDDIDKLKIINKIIKNKSEAMIVEILEPTIINYFKIFLATTLGVLVFSPFIKPFDIKRMIFTYIIPINILTISYDGLISVYKSKTASQYQKLFSTLGNNVNIVRYRSLWSPVILIHIKATK